MSIHYGSDKRTYVRAMFAAIAGRYDLMNSLLSLRRDAAWRRFAARRAVPSTGGLVLDVATGTGELARHLALQNGIVSVIGIDFSPEMLARARAKLPSRSRIRLVLGDVLRLPFPDDTFDCVTIAFGLRNVSDIGATFSEMARVARPGAPVVSLELTLPSLPPLRAIYGFGMSLVTPLVGRVVSRNREAYEYLPDSILEFPSPEEVAVIMRDAGLQNVEVQRLSFGAATVHTAIKPA